VAGKRDTEETMNTLSRNKLTDAIGACTAIAGVLLLAAMVIPANPLGRLVGALIGASLLTGIVGAFVRERLAHRNQGRHTTQCTALLQHETPAGVVVAMPQVADATASEFDGRQLPAFAPVVSLTEAQVERGRAARQRQKRREALSRA
jgi:hypothetical protein